MLCKGELLVDLKKAFNGWERSCTHSASGKSYLWEDMRNTKSLAKAKVFLEENKNTLRQKMRCINSNSDKYPRENCIGPCSYI